MAEASPDVKTRLLDAAIHLVRERGYEASTIEDFCAEANVSKGAFFHHFSGKEQFAVAAAQRFGNMADSLFRNAPYQSHSDPLDRLFGYLDLRKQILTGALYEYTCVLGALAQEAYETHPAIRRACDTHLRQHCAMLEEDIAAAKALYAADAAWNAATLAFHIQAVLQGAFILAKAQYGASVAADCIDHLRRYIELLFTQSTKQERTP